MAETDIRIVGERGQVTIPKKIRMREHIHSGDKVKIIDRDGDIVIKKVDLSEELKEGYVKMSEMSKKISEEMLTASKEALDRP